MERIIKIELFGQPHSFRAKAPLPHAEKIADYVVKQVETAQKQGEVPNKLDIVILAALNIANDYFDMKCGHEELLKSIDQRCKTLMEYIDANG